MFSGLFQQYQFDRPETLEANRAGRVTEEQKAALEGLVDNFRDFLKRTNRDQSLKIMGWGVFFLSAGLLSLDVPNFYVILFFSLGVIAFGGWFFYLQRVYAQQKEILHRDLSHNNIRSDTGEVIFQGSDYRISVEGKDLKLPFDHRADLEPGVSYRFYYLQESGLVISAEALSIDPELEAVTGLNDVLAEANGFSRDALLENRRGILSKGQGNKLLEPLLLGVFLIVFTLGVGYFSITRDNVISRTIADSRHLRDFVRGIDTGTLIILIVVMGVGLAGVYLLITSLQDLLTRRVESWEGLGMRTYRQDTDSDGSTHTNYYYVIGGKEFKVNKRAYEAFENGRTYRVYFTPRRKRMVNLEVLD